MQMEAKKILLLDLLLIEILPVSQSSKWSRQPHSKGLRPLLSPKLTRHHLRTCITQQTSAFILATHVIRTRVCSHMKRLPHALVFLPPPLRVTSLSILTASQV